MTFSSPLETYKSTVLSFLTCVPLVGLVFMTLPESTSLLGCLMIFPTLGVAIYIIYKTRFLKEVYINFAVFFWILENSFWMICEFFINDLYRHYAIIPFIIGFIFVIIFYLKTLIKKA